MVITPTMCLDVLKVLVFLMTISIQTITGAYQKCNCIPQDKCQSHLLLLRSLQRPLTRDIVHYLKERICGYEEDFPMVCCQDSITTPTQKMKKKLCEKQSDCTILKDCGPFMKIIKSMEKPLRPTVIDFLRSQECGFEQGYPMVCCSLLPLKTLKKLKCDTRRPLNKLSADFDQMVTPVTTKISEKTKFAIPSHNVHNNADDLNKAFMSDYFDFADSFDLMLRIKRHDQNDFLDIEIR